MSSAPTSPSDQTAAARGARHLVRRAMRRHWRSLGAGGFGALLVTIADLAAPFPLAWVIDKVLANRDGPFTFTSDEIRLLALLVQAVVLVAIVAAVGNYLAEISLQRAGEQITHDLRVMTYGHLQRLSLAYHDRRSKGDLVTRLTADVNAVGVLFSQVIGNIVQAALILIGMAAVAVWLDPLLAAVLFAATPVLAVVTRIFRKRIIVAARKQRHAEAEIASLATESLSSMRVVKAFGTEDYEHERVVGFSERRREVSVVAAALDARFAGIVDVLGAVSMAAVLAFGAVRVSDGALTVGGLVIFLHYSGRVYKPLRSIAKYSTAASRSMARAERIADVLASDETLEERPSPYRGGAARGAVAMEGVSFGYDPDHPVIRDVDFAIEPGETVAVVGASGAGKSTLGALVARFYDPLSGRVLIDGRDARDCSLEWLREQVGFLLQDTVLFTGTIAENIAYGQDASREAVIRAARAADADEFITSLPNGYDEVLGPQGVGLSGGQRQRIGVARVLLRNPPLLVLDEPTTGLDATSEAQLIDGISTLMSGRTSILITHSLALARRADRVLVIANGTVAQEGRPADLLARPGPFRQLASLQGLVGRQRAPLPAPDAALPTARQLLDPDAIAPALQETLGAEREIDAIRIRAARYRPGRRLVVRYDVDVDGHIHEVVAAIEPDDGALEVARDARNLALAAEVNGRSPARTPLAFDPRSRALIQWAPLDIDIVATRVPPGDLAAILREAGLPARVVGEPERLHYQPGRRLTLDMGGTSATCWARTADAERAARSLDHAAAHGLLGPGGRTIHLPALRVTASPAPAGARVTDAAAGAFDAGALLAELHAVPGDGLEIVRPSHEMVSVTSGVDLLAALLPDLRPRLDALTTRMVETGPRAGSLEFVTSHGGFRAGRISRAGDGRLALEGYETLCLAPAALDLASYAATMFDRPEDWGAATDALNRLIDGYGSVPYGLDWYLATALLRRADRPFRAQSPDWPDLVDGMVSLAESVLD